MPVDNSYYMFPLGNELNGDSATMCSVFEYFKSIGRRHLYAKGSNNFFADPYTFPIENFFVSMRAGKMATNNA